MSTPDQYLQAQLGAERDKVIVRTAPITQRAAILDITIEQGRRFFMPVKWQELGIDNAEAPSDLTGWTFTFTVRKSQGGELVHQIVSVPIAEEAIAIEIAHTATAVMTGWYRGVYDLVAAKGSERVRLLEGVAQLSAGVTP